MHKNFFYILFIGLFLLLTACSNTTEDQHPAYSNPAILPFTQKINDDPDDAILYYQRAEALLQIEMDSLSIVDLKKAIALDPDNVEYQYTLAVLYMYNDEPALSSEILEKIIDEYAHHLSAHLFLAQAYIALKDFDALEKTFLKIDNIDQTHPEVYYLKSEWALMTKDTTLAEEYLVKLTDTYPDYYKGWILRAEIKANQNDEKFIEIYEKAFALDTLDVRPYFEIGEWYKSQNRIDDAMVYYEKCIQTDLDFTPAYMSLGKIYLSRDSLEKAYRHFNLASQTRINFGDAYYYQSVALYKAGEIKAAQDAIRQALVYDKNNKLYQEHWNILFNK